MNPRSLSAFVLARIAEEEAGARDARRWLHEVGQRRAGPDCDMASPVPVSEAFAAFVLAHEPTRVVIDCAAKRKIIKLVTGKIWDGSRADRDSVLRLLALPYVGHPAFRDEWRESS